MSLKLASSSQINVHGKAVKTSTVIVIFIFFYIVLASGIFVVLSSKKNGMEQHHLNLTTEKFQLAYNTINEQYEQLAKNIQSGMMARFDIQEVYQKILVADEEQKNILRKKLFNQISQRFEEMQEESLVQFLHFHLPGNESFLRLHRPDKFGDDLSDIRPTVVYVNRERTAVSGFESGRLHGGYRFIFPLSSDDGTHLGSMEISFGPEAMTSSLMKQYYVLSNFFTLEKSKQNKHFPDETQPDYRPSHHKGYLYDEKVLAALEQVSRQEMKALKPKADVTARVLANAESGTAQSIYDSGINIVLTTIPVFNPVTQEMVAFCTIRSQSDFFTNEQQHFRIALLFSQLLLAMIFLTFYLQFHKRKILEAHSIVLEEQKNQLIKTQKVLQRQQDMFMQGPVMTFTWANTEGWPVTQASQNTIDILGYNSEEFLDGTVDFLSLVHADDKQAISDDVRNNSVPGKKTFTHDPYRLKSRSGEMIWVFDSTLIVRNTEGEITHFQGYLVDITKMVLMEKEVVETKDLLKTAQREEQQKRLESLKTMAGAIAHRFNNAMMAVEGNLELLRCALPEDANEYRMATEAARAAKGASQVGSMMLSYVGQKPLQLQEISLPDFVGKSVAAFQEGIQPSLSLEFSYPDKPVYCSVDQLQIGEVFESILTNAQESIGDGPGNIEITFGTTELQADSVPIPFQSDKLEDGSYVFCQIKDTGHGISPKNLSFIFEPFYTTRFVGRGLGLALTVGIMRTHHGAIVIESIPGTGTTVKILFPPVLSIQQAQLPIDDVAPQEATQLSGNLLFVDDEEMVLDVGKKMLQMLGFNVFTATTGQEAIDMVRDRSGYFCIVVMDISMPGMDGFAAMKEIRQNDPNLLILLSSGYSEEDFATKIGTDGRPDGFLNKPFLIADMRKSLERLLSV